MRKHPTSTIRLVSFLMFTIPFLHSDIHQILAKKLIKAHGNTTFHSGVAQILSSEGGIADSIVLAAAYLHDTVEDTDATIEDIEKEFGREVCDDQVNSFHCVCLQQSVGFCANIDFHSDNYSSFSLSLLPLRFATWSPRSRMIRH